MTGYKGFFEWIGRIVNAPREGSISDLELSDLGLSRADFAMLRSGHPTPESAFSRWLASLV